MAKGGIDIGGVAVVGLAAFVVYQLAKKKNGTVNPTLPPNWAQTVFNLASRTGFNSETGYTLPDAYNSAVTRQLGIGDAIPDKGIDVGPTIYDQPGVTTVNGEEGAP